MSLEKFDSNESLNTTFSEGSDSSSPTYSLSPSSYSPRVRRSGASAAPKPSSSVDARRATSPGISKSARKNEPTSPTKHTPPAAVRSPPREEGFVIPAPRAPSTKSPASPPGPSSRRSPSASGGDFSPRRSRSAKQQGSGGPSPPARRLRSHKDAGSPASPPTSPRRPNKGEGSPSTSRHLAGPAANGGSGRRKRSTRAAKPASAATQRKPFADPLVRRKEELKSKSSEEGTTSTDTTEAASPPYIPPTIIPGSAASSLAASAAPPPVTTHPHGSAPAHAHPHPAPVRHLPAVPPLTPTVLPDPFAPSFNPSSASASSTTSAASSTGVRARGAPSSGRPLPPPPERVDRPLPATPGERERPLPPLPDSAGRETRSPHTRAASIGGASTSLGGGASMSTVTPKRRVSSLQHDDMPDSPQWLYQSPRASLILGTSADSHRMDSLGSRFDGDEWSDKRNSLDADLLPGGPGGAERKAELIRMAGGSPIGPPSPLRSRVEQERSREGSAGGTVHRRIPSQKTADALLTAMFVGHKRNSTEEPTLSSSHEDLRPRSALAPVPLATRSKSHGATPDDYEEDDEDDEVGTTATPGRSVVDQSLDPAKRAAAMRALLADPGVDTSSESLYGVSRGQHDSPAVNSPAVHSPAAGHERKRVHRNKRISIATPAWNSGVRLTLSKNPNAQPGARPGSMRLRRSASEESLQRANAGGAPAAADASGAPERGGEEDVVETTAPPVAGDGARAHGSPRQRGSTSTGGRGTAGEGTTSTYSSGGLYGTAKLEQGRSASESPAPLDANRSMHKSEGEITADNDSTPSLVANVSDSRDKLNASNDTSTATPNRGAFGGGVAAPFDLSGEFYRFDFSNEAYRAQITPGVLAAMEQAQRAAHASTAARTKEFSPEKRSVDEERPVPVASTTTTRPTTTATTTTTTTGSPTIAASASTSAMSRQSSTAMSRQSSNATTSLAEIDHDLDELNASLDASMKMMAQLKTIITRNPSTGAVVPTRSMSGTNVSGDSDAKRGLTRSPSLPGTLDAKREDFGATVRHTPQAAPAPPQTPLRDTSVNTSGVNTTGVNTTGVNTTGVLSPPAAAQQASPALSASSLASSPSTSASSVGSPLNPGAAEQQALTASQDLAALERDQIERSLLFASNNILVEAEAYAADADSDSSDHGGQLSPLLYMAAGPFASPAATPHSVLAALSALGSGVPLAESTPQHVPHAGGLRPVRLQDKFDAAEAAAAAASPAPVAASAVPALSSSVLSGSYYGEASTYASPDKHARVPQRSALGIGNAGGTTGAANASASAPQATSDIDSLTSSGPLPEHNPSGSGLSADREVSASSPARVEGGRRVITPAALGRVEPGSAASREGVRGGPLVGLPHRETGPRDASDAGAAERAAPAITTAATTTTTTHATATAATATDKASEPLRIAGAPIRSAPGSLNGSATSAAMLNASAASAGVASDPGAGAGTHSKHRSISDTHDSGVVASASGASLANGPSSPPRGQNFMPRAFLPQPDLSPALPQLRGQFAEPAPPAVLAAPAILTVPAPAAPQARPVSTSATSGADESTSPRSSSNMSPSPPPRLVSPANALRMDPDAGVDGEWNPRPTSPASDGTSDASGGSPAARKSGTRRRRSRPFPTRFENKARVPRSLSGGAAVASAASASLQQRVPGVGRPGTDAASAPRPAPAPAATRVPLVSATPVHAHAAHPHPTHTHTPPAAAAIPTATTTPAPPTAHPAPHPPAPASSRTPAHPPAHPVAHTPAPGSTAPVATPRTGPTGIPRARAPRRGSDASSSSSSSSSEADPEKVAWASACVRHLQSSYTIEEDMTAVVDNPVYKCRRMSDGRPVAVKCLPLKPHHPPSSEPGEVRCLMKVRGHPNVQNLVTWFPVATDPVAQVIVSDFVSHSSPLDTSDPVAVRNHMRDILTGLEYIHQCGILHGDIKPDNIVIEKDTNKAVIIDFDAAVLFNPQFPPDDWSGTEGFIAPEIDPAHKRHGRRPYSQAVDIWSTGIVFAGIIYERHVPEDDDCLSFEHVARLVAQESVQTHAHHLLMAMLTVDPRRRITAAQALQHPFFTAGGAAAPARAGPKTPAAAGPHQVPYHPSPAGHMMHSTPGGPGRGGFGRGMYPSGTPVSATKRFGW